MTAHTSKPRLIVTGLSGVLRDGWPENPVVRACGNIAGVAVRPVEEAGGRRRGYFGSRITKRQLDAASLQRVAEQLEGLLAKGSSR